MLHLLQKKSCEIKMGVLTFTWMLIQVLHFSSCQNSYISTVPHFIRPGDVAEITIASAKTDAWTSDVDVTLYDSMNKSISNIKANCIQGTTQPAIVLLPIPNDVKSDETYKIRVKSINGLTFDEMSDKIFVASKSASIFIQTDKPQYKPGDLVQFRMFGTDSKLQISKDSLTIYIEDPKGNRLQQYLNAHPEMGVFADSFQLSTLTSMGTWKLIVEQGREKNTKTFVVEDVVLPKFEVNVILPSIQLTTDSHFTATITAQYTFGKPVEGDVLLSIYSGSKRRGITKRFKINGKATIRVLMSEIAPRFRYFTVEAEVTEAVTGDKQGNAQRTHLYETQEKLLFSPTMPYTFKPGLDYNIILRATQENDKALTGYLGQVNVTVFYRVPKQKEEKTGALQCTEGMCPPSDETEEKVLWSKNIQIPESGLMKEVASFPINALSGQVQADYRMASDRKYLSKAQSPSSNYIQVTIVNDQKAKAGTNLPLMIKATEPVQYVNYKIFAKQYMMQQGTFDMQNTSSKQVQIAITTDMAPKVKLLVYYTRPSDGEIVAAAVKFPIEGIFDYEVTLRFNKERALPGDNVTLSVTADPNSLVSVLAVDKSVLLLRTGNDVTVKDVINELNNYDGNLYPNFGAWDYWFSRPISSIDASSVFKDMGVYVLTDSLLYKHSEVVRRSQSFNVPMNAEILAMDAPAMSFTSGGMDDLAKPSRTRKNFPETWLWTNTMTGASGISMINAKAPDTITEWVTSAFAVNPTSGLGVSSDIANLTIFQKFFMRFELPYSTIRGEIVIVQITLFNYLTTAQNVQVKVNAGEGFSFVDANGDPLNTGSNGMTKTTLVKNDSVSSVYFPIKPTAVGKIILSATARSTEAADAVERELIVEAEGIKQSYNIPLLLDVTSPNQGTVIRTPLTFPPNRVPDSTFIKVQVVGDILGPALANLENLLGSTSYGSGEQNMITFVPNVYISSYLKTTNRLTTEIKKKTERLMQGGYQRQLSFARIDGSFSAFGSNDPRGSTWLTAYVIKSFAQAAEFTYIDKKVITKAIKWLLTQQAHSGNFEENGIFIRKELQGGSISSARSLTAFVLIALYEAKSNDQVDAEIKSNVDSAISKATQFVAEGAPASITNVYELAISFYALSLVKHASKNLLLVELEKKESIDGEEKFWRIPKTEADIIQPWKEWSPQNEEFRALDIETTAYMLQGYNLNDDTKNGTRILRWFGRRRGSRGGFKSAQDTAIALEGLSELAKKLYVPSTSLTINVKADNWAGRTFNIRDENSLVLQNEDITTLVDYIEVTTSGTGISLMDIDVYFNVMSELRVPAFNMTTALPKDSTKGFRLRICFSYLKDDESGMALLEISLPSGMEADLTSLDTSRTWGKFKKAEKAFRQINLYFESIQSRNMCVELDVNRVSLVARHQAVPIRLSEISEPSNEVIRLYKSKALSTATIIEVCGADNCQELRK